MRFGPLIDQLMEAFRCLPGVGPRSAQRMTLHLLERDRAGGGHLAQVLLRALACVGRCERCRNLSETALCPICSSMRRDAATLCVVETPADVLAIEQAGGYSGLYFVLLGRLSPIDGIGPEELGLEQLLRRVDDEGIREVILATNPTAEGEATAYFITERLRGSRVTVSRIAHGVPLGGELEYVDGGTLLHALQGRKPL
ncbi:MAG TPA: recombination mediator RecR [Pseudomonadales bacterium]|nr:recombination mediator RecR [Pseudomonadales bacterium]HND13778.1 recombination mediator RecR [Pseudomonadales bacterium]